LPWFTSCVVLAAVTVLLPLSPGATVFIALTGLCLLSVVRPKVAFVLSLCALFLAPSLGEVVDDRLTVLLDEGLVTFWIGHALVRRVVTRERFHWLPGTGFFIGFLVSGLAAAVISSVPVGVALSGAFLAVKGILFGLAAAQLGWRRADVRVLVVAGAGLTAVVIAGCLANALAPGAWTDLLAPGRGLQSEFGLPALIGPFTRPGALGRAASLLGIAALAYALTMARN
jgi:hypothetical protein